MKIDTVAIQAELDALINPVLTDGEGQMVRRPKDSSIKVVVKIDLRMTSKMGTDETDHGYTVRLNRRKIRNQAQLDDILANLSKEVEHIYK